MLTRIDEDDSHKQRICIDEVLLFKTRFSASCTCYVSHNCIVQNISSHLCTTLTQNLSGSHITLNHSWNCITLPESCHFLNFPSIFRLFECPLYWLRHNIHITHIYHINLYIWGDTSRSHVHVHHGDIPTNFVVQSGYLLPPYEYQYM